MNIPLARAGHTAIMYGGEMYIFGGYQLIGQSILMFNDLWKFNFTNLSWEEVNPISSFNPSSRSFSIGIPFSYNNESFLLFWGGWNFLLNVYIPEIWIFNPSKIF